MCKKIKCSDNSLDEVPEVAALSRGYATFSGIQCWLRRSITVLGVTCAGAGNMTLGRGIIFILSVFTTVPILGLWSSRRVGQQHSCRALSLRLRRRRRPKELARELEIRDRMPRPQFPHGEYVAFADELAAAIGVFRLSGPHANIEAAKMQIESACDRVGLER